RKNPYKNRKRTKWAKHTRTVIFFTRILARVRLNQDTKSVKIRIKIGNGQSGLSTLGRLSFLLGF
ncbi:hypothetical protein RFF84_10855, partial [Streptococcus ruminantium]